jgi:hypothetical protein
MKTLILLSLITLSSLHAETRTQERDVLWECSFNEGVALEIHGEVYSEYSNWVYQVYPTKKSGVFLVKVGIRDQNAGAEFVFDKEWTAKEIRTLKGTTYQSLQNSKNFITVSSERIGRLSYFKGNADIISNAVFQCEERPWE